MPLARTARGHVARAARPPCSPRTQTPASHASRRAFAPRRTVAVSTSNWVAPPRPRLRADSRDAPATRHDLTHDAGSVPCCHEVRAELLIITFAAYRFCWPRAKGSRANLLSSNIILPPRRLPCRKPHRIHHIHDPETLAAVQSTPITLRERRSSPSRRALATTATTAVHRSAPRRARPPIQLEGAGRRPWDQHASPIVHIRAPRFHVRLATIPCRVSQPARRVLRGDKFWRYPNAGEAFLYRLLCFCAVLCQVHYLGCGGKSSTISGWD